MILILKFIRVFRKRKFRAFIACGEQDDLVGKGVRDLRETLKERNIPFIDRLGQGNHEMAYWEEQMDPAFSFLAGIEPGTKARLILENRG